MISFEEKSNLREKQEILDAWKTNRYLPDLTRHPTAMPPPPPSLTPMVRQQVLYRYRPLHNDTPAGIRPETSSPKIQRIGTK